MAVDVTLDTITSGYSLSKINDNFTAIDTALQDAVSRSGTLPNTMSADFDLNSNNLLNVANLAADTITLDGNPVTLSNLATLTADSVNTAAIQDGAITEHKLAENSITSTQLTAAHSLALSHTVSDRSALKALDTTRYKAVYLQEGGREGEFVWDSSDLSTQVSSDTQEGLYVAPPSDATGASGAWTRQYSGALNVKWFGALGDGATNDVTAIQAAINEIPDTGGDVYLPKGVYVVGSELTCPGKDCMRFIGEVRGQDSTNYGTCIKSSTTDQTILNFTGANHIHVSNLLLDGDNTAGKGLRLGIGATHAQHIVVQDVCISGVKGSPGIALDLAGTGGAAPGGSPADCIFRNLMIAGAIVGVDNYAQDNGFHDCIITGCTNAGLRVNGYSLSTWTGGLFSGNDTDIKINTTSASDSAASQQFFGTYFENSTNAMVDGSTHCSDISFFSCFLNTASTTRLIDLDGLAAGNLTIIGGKSSPVGSSSTRINLGSNYKAVIQNLELGSGIALTFDDASRVTMLHETELGMGVGYPNYRHSVGFTRTNGVSTPMIVGQDTDGSNSGSVNLHAEDTTNGFFGLRFSTFRGGAGNREAWQMTSDLHLLPVTDNVSNLGSASFRCNTIYASVGTINTSDRNLKRDIRTLEDKERLVSKEIRQLLRAYRLKSDGDDGDSQIHFGVVAQDVKAAFEKHGLDASKYALLQEDSLEVDGEKKTRFGVRYSELYAFILSTI